MEKPAQTLCSLGFDVQFSKNLFSTSYGFAGSVTERAEDFDQMISDDRVKMLLFGGGEVCNEILPFIDYDNVARHPKILCSYSDSTTLLNAVQYKTGLITFYGASPRTFDQLIPYNWQSFQTRLMSASREYVKSGSWKTICPGTCRGRLTGGYLVNYAALQGSPFYRQMPDASCILFIEDHEMFSSPAVVSKWFSHMMQRGVFENVSGLIFGHYSKEAVPAIDEILFRLGSYYQIPVVRCEDYGHGENNAVLPIGICAQLDTEADVFLLLEDCVE